MKLQFMSPTKRMFLGFGALIGGVIGAVAWIALTIGFTMLIGFLPTAFMEAILLLMFVIYRIVYRVRALGHKYSTVREWDTKNADLEGSTARFGVPFDQGSHMSRRKPSALPRKS